MAYIKKTWENRDVEFPSRRILEKKDGTTEQVTVFRDEGIVTTEGDSFSAETMNNLEDRIELAFNNIPMGGTSVVEISKDDYDNLPTIEKMKDVLYLVDGKPQGGGGGGGGGNTPILTIPSQSGSLEYNGYDQTPLWDNYDPTQLTIGGDAQGANAGTYTATFTPNVGYEWADGSVDAKNATWVIDKVDGNLSVSKTSVQLNNANKTDKVTVSSSTGIVSATSNDTNIATVSKTGNVITISSPNEKTGTATITVTVAESTNYKSVTKQIDVIAEFIEVKAFADATWDEISDLLDAHYAGEINIGDYWSVGDVKTGVPLGSISAVSPLTDTHSAQNVDLVIVGIEHDDLASAINGKTKAAVTLSMKNALNTMGKMNTSDTSYFYARWESIPRHLWMGNFEDALPSSLKGLIKTVTKETAYPKSSSNAMGTENVIDKCFLFSHGEVFGGGYSGYTYADGSQYEYYKTQGNRIKERNGSLVAWWLRSGFYNTTSSKACFIFCNSTGDVGYYYATKDYGISVGFCL